MNYAVIARHVAAFAVRVLCRTLGVSVSGSSAWRLRAKAGPSAHEQADTIVSGGIRFAFLAGRAV